MTAVLWHQLLPQPAEVISRAIACSYREYHLGLCLERDLDEWDMANETVAMAGEQYLGCRADMLR